ncbi:TPA: hypothetical protein ACH3X2_008916 [Trebouxia sp. C0005]
MREDTKQLKLKTALCLQATSDMGNALSKCHNTHEEFEQACMDLAELEEEYEPKLMRLPGNAPKYAVAQVVQEYDASRQRALSMLQRAKVVVLNNNPNRFAGYALGQIIAASQGSKVDHFIMDSCSEGSRCSEIAEVLKDFKQDLLEEQSKAAERHSMRVQELELQVLTATQVHPDIFRLPESALWMLESCAYDSIEESHAQRRQLACMTSQAKDDAAQRQAQLEAQQTYAAGVLASHVALQQRAEGAEAFCAALQQHKEDAEAANAALAKQAQAANELCSSVLRRLHEVEQANKSLRCQLHEQEQVTQGLQAVKEQLQTQLSAERERAKGAEQGAQLLECQLKTEGQKAEELLAGLRQEHAQALQAVQAELSTANSKLADSQKDALAAHQTAERLHAWATAAEDGASVLQRQLAAAQQALLTEQQGHMDAKQTNEGLQACLQAAEERSLHLQAQLEKAQKQLSVDAQAHEDAIAPSQAQMETAHQSHEVAIAERQRQVRAAQQTGASFQTRWEEGPQELASEEQAHQAAKQTVAEVQVQLGKGASRARFLQQDLPEAQADLASLKQATLAGGKAIEARPLEEAAQHRPSILQVVQDLLCCNGPVGRHPPSFRGGGLQQRMH